jgi:broad specificity phosphatase PhoE
MLLYLRHGDDRGDDIYRHDRPLNAQGRHEVGRETRKLLERYEHPQRVFVSPFRRARETLVVMTPHFQRHVEIHQDPRIAQRLSGRQQREANISPATLAAITLGEDGGDFRRRVAAHAKDMRAWAALGTVWCVTHQAVIEEVAPHFGKKIRKSLDFLDCLLMLD